MKKLEAMFARLRAAGEAAFMPFLVVGDPDAETTIALSDALVEAGADLLEFGFPFSDPPADGPVIQLADVRALEGGMTVAKAWDTLAEVHRRHPDVPQALLVYFNLVMQAGTDAFFGRGAEVGVEAILVADVPLEHAAELVEAGARHGIAPVFVASELSSDARLQALAEVGKGYVYAVARVGTTGEQAGVDEGLPVLVERIRAQVSLPILAGFGISTPEHVRAVIDAGADGAICGSAIVRRIEQNLGDTDAMVRSVGAFAAEMKAATRNTSTSES